MVNHGTLSVTMVGHGKPWDYFSLPWWVMVNHGTLWVTMVGHGKPWDGFGLLW